MVRVSACFGPQLDFVGILRECVLWLKGGNGEGADRGLGNFLNYTNAWKDRYPQGICSCNYPGGEGRGGGGEDKTRLSAEFFATETVWTSTVANLKKSHVRFARFATQTLKPTGWGNRASSPCC